MLVTDPVKPTISIDCGTIHDFRKFPDTNRHVVFLAQGASTGAAERNLAHILETYLDHGIDLVCLEGADSSRIRPRSQRGASPIGKVIARRSSSTYQFLRTLRKTHSLSKAVDAYRVMLQIYGVDDMVGHAQMSAILATDAREWTEYAPLFNWIIDATMDRIRNPDARDVARLQRSWSSGDYNLSRIFDQFEILLSKYKLMNSLPQWAKYILSMRTIEKAAHGIYSDPEKELREIQTRMTYSLKTGNVNPRLWSGYLKQEGLSPDLKYPDDLPEVLAHCQKVINLDNSSALITVGDTSIHRKIEKTNKDAIVHSSLEADMLPVRLLMMARTVGMAAFLNVDFASYSGLQNANEMSYVLIRIGESGQTPVSTKVMSAIGLYFDLLNTICGEEAELLRVIRRVSILERLARLQFTPDDYTSFEDELRNDSLFSIVETLARYNILVPAIHSNLISRFDRDCAKYQKYYEIAQQRGKTIAANTVTTMEELSMDSAILLCSGFHIPTVCLALSRKNISYTVIMPEI